jgi:hypothetical protein
MVMVPKWKLSRLLQSHFYTLPLADSLIQKQNAQIDTLYLAFKALKKLDSLHVVQRDNKAKEAEILRNKEANLKEIHKQEITKAKKKGFKLGAIVTSIPAILLIIVLL